MVPARRRQGIGSALFAEISTRARGLGRDEIQGEVQEGDAESRAFFERRGFVQTGGEKAVVLELDGIEPPEVDPPKGVRIVSRAEEPDRLDEMYAVAVQADEDIPGSAGRQSYERWRAMDIDRPNCLPELCFIALVEDAVVGYAFLQASGEENKPPKAPYWAIVPRSPLPSVPASSGFSPRARNGTSRCSA